MLKMFPIWKPGGIDWVVLTDEERNKYWSLLQHDGTVRDEVSNLWDELKYAFVELLGRVSNCWPEIFAKLEAEPDAIYEIVSIYADEYFYIALAEIEQTMERLGLYTGETDSAKIAHTAE